MNRETAKHQKAVTGGNPKGWARTVLGVSRK